MTHATIDQKPPAAQNLPSASVRELQRQLRGLAHDFGATFIMLESSFKRVKKLGQDAASAEPFDDQVRQLEACIAQSRHYVDDLVRLSTSGRVAMEAEAVDVASIVSELLVEQADLLRLRRIRVDIARDLPRLWCHRGRVKDILLNLLRNAARHGCDPDDPRILIEPIAADDPTMAGVRVWDNGPGLPAEVAEEIFLPGRQLPQSGGGTGWGLALARRTAEAFDGSLQLEPDCPHGTALRLVLPRTTAPALPERREPIETGDGSSLQLDREHRSRWGHHVRSAQRSPADDY